MFVSVVPGGKGIRRSRKSAELVEKKDGEEQGSAFFLLFFLYAPSVPDYKYEGLPQFGTALTKHSQLKFYSTFYLLSSFNHVGCK